MNNKIPNVATTLGFVLNFRLEIVIQQIVRDFIKGLTIFVKKGLLYKTNKTKCSYISRNISNFHRKFPFQGSH